MLIPEQLAAFKLKTKKISKEWMLSFRFPDTWIILLIVSALDNKRFVFQ